MGGRRVRATSDALLAALAAVGAPPSDMAGLGEAVRARRLQLSRRVVEPVVVAWDGRADVSVRVPARLADGRVFVEVEEGEVVALDAPRFAAQAVATSGRTSSPPQVTVLGHEDVEGSDYVRLSVRHPATVPFGYHTLHVRAGRGTASALLISAPLEAHGPEDPPSWGVFLPLYALRTARSWGTGDITDLRSLLRWTAGRKGELVGTLPLLAAFLDDEGPFDPSPYAPATRLFWNELYVDPTAIPGFERSSEARRLAGSAAFRRRVARLRAAPLIDYREAMRTKRRVFEILSRELFDEPRSSPDRRSLDAFRRANPAIDDYAGFRAATRRHGSGWPAWPARERDGRLPATGGDEAGRRYHLFVQWAADQQMRSLAGTSGGAGLYVDLPLGVHAEGYDVWRERHAFVTGASAGAPPDQFFSGGQNWGFPPPHADGDRERGYRYFRACIQHLFQPAAAARIDHVMGLHRVFVIPSGLAPSDGVYVRQRPDELYAILALESRRFGTAVVGEDLGTVPAEVRPAMRRRGIHRSYVLQFQLKPNRRPPMRSAPLLSAATVGTHDTPTFAAFWLGLDIDQRLDRGWISEAEAARLRLDRERTRRALMDTLRASGRLAEGRRGDEPSAGAVLRAVLSDLAAGPARMVLVNLEDLWLERRPQNVPGTVASDRDPNWRRPARLPFEEFSARRSVADTLRLVHRAHAKRRSAGLG